MGAAIDHHPASQAVGGFNPAHLAACICRHRAARLGIVNLLASSRSRLHLLADLRLVLNRLLLSIGFEDTEACQGWVSVAAGVVRWDLWSGSVDVRLDRSLGGPAACAGAVFAGGAYLWPYLTEPPSASRSGPRRGRRPPKTSSQRFVSISRLPPSGLLFVLSLTRTKAHG